MERGFLNFIFILSLLIPYAVCMGQQRLPVLHSCSFDGEETQTEFYVFEGTSEAKKIVDEIIQRAGLFSSNFILKEATCKNALATTVNGKRYILYNPDFMDQFSKEGLTKWAAFGVLAHEIAHHLNGHDMATDDIQTRKDQEIQADFYSGHILAKLGATLDEAKSAVNTVPMEGESETHPAKKNRLLAVSNGWKSASSVSEPKNTINNLAEKARIALFTEPPSIENIRSALSDFPFDNNEEVNVHEAKKILEWLLARNITALRINDGIAEPYFIGILPTGYEVAIWTGTYQKKDRYGIRYGDPNNRSAYIGSNDSYFEILKK